MARSCSNRTLQWKRVVYFTDADNPTELSAGNGPTRVNGRSQSLERQATRHRVLEESIDVREREVVPVWSRYSNGNLVSRICGPADRLNPPFLSDRYSTPSEGVAMDWKTMLTYISGSVDEELLLRNEYLVAENRILRNQIQGRLRLTDGERRTLAEIGKRLGKRALQEVVSIVKPDTILGWHRRLVAKKFDGSKSRHYPGRPRVDADIEELVASLAQENKSWGYDRIAGALANLGHEVSDQTVGNILKRHGIPPAPERKKTTTWTEFIRSHMKVLAATDFFTAEVWTQGGLVTYYVLFFYPPRDPARPHRRHHAASERTVDDSSGPQRDHGRCRLSLVEPISHPRPGLQVLRVVPGHH